jgi:predicted N-acyltransferase
MSTFSFRLNPPKLWDAHCSTHNALFHSCAWQALLEQSFGCQSVYGWNPGTSTGMTISNFRVGPFSIGYLGFPVGGLIGTDILNRSMAMRWREARLPYMPHCLRIPMSAFGNHVDLKLPCSSNPETAIVDLQGWDLSSVSKKLRRDIKKARRSDLMISDVTDITEGSVLYRIYHDTVKRHSGALRYNEVYFSSLVTLGRSHPNLRCLTARMEGEIAGFAIIARHGNTAYYLHGGSSFAFRQQSPSDLLLHEAITWARQEGCICFNFMTSSSEQPSLVKYKEKWGAVTRQHKTYVLSLKPSFCHSFRFAERIYSRVRRAIAT